MKILITGASGFLGAKLYSMYGSDTSTEIRGTYASKARGDLIQLDVTNREHTIKVISDLNPDIVIHTVALSDTDYCEEHKPQAEKINYEGTVNIVDACKKIGARLDFISTIYVFDGTEKFYTEEMNPNPLNWYGKTKLIAEAAVRSLPRYGIYRSDKIYGFNGLDQENGYLSKILQGEPFTVNADLLAHPVFADDYCRAIQKMQVLNETGILHVAGPERMTKLELTKGLAKLVGKDSIVLGIQNKNQSAPRPEMLINTEKARSLGIAFTPINESYRIIAEQLKLSGIKTQERTA